MRKRAEPHCGLARPLETAAQIYKFVLVDCKKCEGAERAKILIKNQLKGIQMAATLRMTIKANTLLIPSLNDDHCTIILCTINNRLTKNPFRAVTVF